MNGGWTNILAGRAKNPQWLNQETNGRLGTDPRALLNAAFGRGFDEPNIGICERSRCGICSHEAANVAVEVVVVPNYADAHPKCLWMSKVVSGLGFGTLGKKADWLCSPGNWPPLVVSGGWWWMGLIIDNNDDDEDVISCAKVCRRWESVAGSFGYDVERATSFNFPYLPEPNFLLSLSLSLSLPLSVSREIYIYIFLEILSLERQDPNLPGHCIHT
jgi:hypothetical protein